MATLFLEGIDLICSVVAVANASSGARVVLAVLTISEVLGVPAICIDMAQDLYDCGAGPMSAVKFLELVLSFFVVISC